MGKGPVKVGFFNTATCIDVQPEGEELPASQQLARMAIYARQIFIHQPNRRFVRVLAITGNHLRLFHFDRAGAEYTQPLNFDDHPHTFVRLILGLSSPNEADIGLDPSIQWKVENGRKVSGTLTTRIANNIQKVYNLVHVDPYLRHSHIGGSGTTCWIVSDFASGETLLVKDAWNSDKRTAEHLHLEVAVGVPGVAQMVSCEPDRGQTRNLRSLEQDRPVPVENRVEARIVMKYYGRSIVYFQSAKQLLCALRDAIADVSIANVRLGIPGAKPGERGLLTNLDMATRLSESGFHPAVDWRIGTPLFQSTSVLYSVETEEPHQPPPHDHWDDLESFFYILTYIICTYDSQGVCHPVDQLMKQWKGYSGQNASDAKGIFLAKGRFVVSDRISPRWPKAVLDVFRSFGSFLDSRLRDRLNTRYIDRDEVLELSGRMASDADHHYAEILQIFDAGIEALEAVNNTVIPLVPSASLRGSSKRTRKGDTDEPIPKHSNWST
ncbi:hypothetical protein MD484_g5415, partial [Candolleomyces efflorescens]